MPILPFHLSYTALLEVLGLLSIASFLLSLLLIPFLVSRASADYFLTHTRTVEQRHHRHPALAIVIKIVRNSLGGFLCLAGIMMLFLPGQGLLTILIGASLLDVPGRQKVLDALIRRPTIQHALNWMRHTTGRPPFHFPSP